MLKRLFASNKRPYFKESSSWDTLDFDLSGCKFQISLPPQDYEFPEKRQGPNLNIFDEQFYKYQTESDKNGFPSSNKGVSRGGNLHRNWHTYSSVFRFNHAGTLSCSMVVNDTSRMEGQIDCFNPEVMERLIISSAYYTFGPGFGENENLCPVNWQLKVINGITWIYHEAWSKIAEWDEDPGSHWPTHFSARLFVPVFSDKYLMISFRSLGSLPSEKSNQLMFSRINEIIDSVKIQLSPEGNKQKVEAKHRYSSSRYSVTRKPEPWKYYESFRDGDILEGEPQVVIEGKCSPPPKVF